MSSNHLNQNQLELLSAYVDGELHEDERKVAESLLLQPDAKAYTAGIISQKNRLKQACSHVKAPQALHQRCLEAIQTSSEDNAIDTSTGSGVKFGRIWWAAAAAVLIFSLIGILRPPVMISDSEVSLSSYLVEDHVYRHFNADEPVLLTSFTTSEAQDYIFETWDINMTVPKLEGAVFSGFSYSEFVPDYHTPVLVYHTEEGLEPILIFAFDVETLDGAITLIRDEMAVKTCIHPDSVHIKDISGKHVVSWMWNNTWYAGVSNHHGEMLASRLPINR